MISSRQTRSIAWAAPLLIGAAVFTLAGGFVHMGELLDGYRHVPASAPGSSIVRIGFPVNAGVSVLLAAALVFCALRPTRMGRVVVVSAVLFQAASLATLIATRVGTVFGWTEPVWTRGANQSRAVEIGALLMLAAAAAVTGAQRRRDRIEGAHTPSNTQALWSPVTP